MVGKVAPSPPSPTVPSAVSALGSRRGGRVEVLSPFLQGVGADLTQALRVAAREASVVEGEEADDDDDGAGAGGPRRASEGLPASAAWAAPARAPPALKACSRLP